MKVWASSVDDLRLALYGRKVWHDFAAGGYLPLDSDSLCRLLIQLASRSPEQLVFWHCSTDSVCVSSYLDPDRALESMSIWAGDGIDLWVAPAALYALLD